MAKLVISAKAAAGTKPAVLERTIYVDISTLDRLIPASDIIDDIRDIILTTPGVKGEFAPLRRILDLVDIDPNAGAKAEDLAKEVTAADITAIYQFHSEVLTEAGLVAKGSDAGEAPAGSSTSSTAETKPTTAPSEPA